MFAQRQLDQELHEIQQKLEKSQKEEKETREILKVMEQNFTIVDGTLTWVVEEMKNATFCHEEALTTTLVRHKEDMELVMKCLKKVKHKFLD